MSTAKLTGKLRICAEDFLVCCSMKTRTCYVCGIGHVPETASATFVVIGFHNQCLLVAGRSPSVSKAENIASTSSVGEFRLNG